MTASNGEVDGLHYSSYAQTVRELERSDRIAEAEALLWRLVEAAEAESQAERRAPPAWIYERLAIDLRKQRRYQEEVAVIERYLAQVPGGGGKFHERLQRASDLEKRHSATATVESEVAVATERLGVPDLRPPEADVPLGLAAFVDVETTGLSRTTDEVVELALVLFWFRWDNGRVLRIADRYVGLREPSIPIPPAASRIHGLSMKDVRGKGLDHGRVSAMLSVANLVIAHNASFDFAFVTRLFPEAGTKPWFCSMNGINWRAKGFESKALQALLRGHRINPGKAHRAGSDVDAAVELLSTSNRAGISYLKELLVSGSLSGVSFGPAGKMISNEPTVWRGLAEDSPVAAPKRAGCFASLPLLFVVLFGTWLSW